MKMNKSCTIGILSFLAGMIVAVICFILLTMDVSFVWEKEEPVSEKAAAAEDIQAAEDAEALEAALMNLPVHEPFNLAALGSRHIELMSPDDIPVGSWWTDGDIYFKVLSDNADTLYMVGTDLEEARGIEITFVKHPDSTMVTDGASVYAFHNSPVLYDRLRLADGRNVDMLVAFYDQDCVVPQSVLIRYHGRGLGHQQVLP